MGAVIFGGRFGHSRGAKMIRSGPIVFVLRFDRRSVRVVFWTCQESSSALGAR